MVSHHKKGAITMAEEAVSIVRRFYEVFNTGDVDASDKVVAEDYDNHAVPGQKLGLEGFKQGVRSLRSAFPDLQVTIEEALAEGDRVATRTLNRGTHRGEFEGIAATGRPVTFGTQAFFRVADGKVQEVWVQWDHLGLREQLGAM